MNVQTDATQAVGFADPVAAGGRGETKILVMPPVAVSSVAALPAGLELPEEMGRRYRDQIAAAMARVAKLEREVSRLQRALVSRGDTWDGVPPRGDSEGPVARYAVEREWFLIKLGNVVDVGQPFEARSLRHSFVEMDAATIGERLRDAVGTRFTAGSGVRCCLIYQRAAKGGDLLYAVVPLPEMAA